MSGRKARGLLCIIRGVGDGRGLYRGCLERGVRGERRKGWDGVLLAK